ncbi:hypothetical protein IJ750_02490 [bacterium]|nr:hypothetical protein [bacterium]
MVNNETIGDSAVISVEGELNDTGYISVSHIKRGDTEPIWDGNLYVYKDVERRDKEALLYRVPVQIKGINSKLSKNLSFSVDASELKQFYATNGVLYFVVEVDAFHFKNNKIYYLDLLPFDISKIMQEEQKSYSIYMKEFPEENGKKMEIIHRFCLESETQPKCVLQRTMNIKHPDILFIPTPKSNNINYINNYKLNYTGTAYAKTEDGLFYPVKKIEYPLNTTDDFLKNADILTGKHHYLFDCEFENDSDTDIIKINKNIKFSFYRDGTIDTTLSIHPDLLQHIQNTEFLFNASIYGTYSINGIVYSFSKDKKIRDELKKIYIYFRRIQKAMDVVGVCSPFTLQEFSSQDIQYANILIDAFSKHKLVSLKTDIDCFILPLKICGSVIICAAFKQPNGQYKLEVIRENTPASVTNDSGKIIPVSPYMILKRDSLQNVINLNFNAFLPDIQKYGTNIEYIKVVNNFALELLSAYDASKEEILLNTAYNIIQWLDSINFDTDIETSIIHHLNLLQCKVRKQLKLTKKDKDYLRNIYKNSDETTFKFGACVILQEKDTAEEYFKQLPLDSQEKLIGVPIYTLWKGLNNG